MSYKINLVVAEYSIFHVGDDCYTVELYKPHYYGLTLFYDLGIIMSRCFKRILDFVASISHHILVPIIPISHGYVQTLTTKYYIPEEKNYVIEHGVDTRKFHMFKKSSSMNNSNK